MFGLIQPSRSVAAEYGFASSGRRSLPPWRSKDSPGLVRPRRRAAGRWRPPTATASASVSPRLAPPRRPRALKGILRGYETGRATFGNFPSLFMGLASSDAPGSTLMAAFGLSIARAESLPT